MPKVLIVDDSQSALYTLRKLVEQAGHQAVTAESGEQALRLAGGRLIGLPDALVARQARLEVADGLRRPIIVREQAGQRLREKVASLTETALEPGRLEQEGALILQRLDVDEEHFVTTTTRELASLLVQRARPAQPAGLPRRHALPDHPGIIGFVVVAGIRTVSPVAAAGARFLIGDLRRIVAGVIHLPARLEQMLRADKGTNAAVINTFARLRKYSYVGHTYLLRRYP